MNQPGEHVADKVDAFLHDLLSSEQGTQVEEHCRSCPECAAELRAAHKRQALLESVPPREATAPLIERVLQRIDAYEAKRQRLRRRTLVALLSLAALFIAVVGVFLTSNGVGDALKQFWSGSDASGRVAAEKAERSAPASKGHPPDLYANPGYGGGYGSYRVVEGAAGGARQPGVLAPKHRFTFDQLDEAARPGKVNEGRNPGEPPIHFPERRAPLGGGLWDGGLALGGGMMGMGGGGMMNGVGGKPGGVGGRQGSASSASAQGRGSGNKPLVWKKDRVRPAFARVYVGDGNSLELVSLQVTVTIDGPRARTVVDHIFHNPHDRQLEGTFEYPLPTGASPSYYAMFLGQTRATVPPRFAGRDGTAPSATELGRLAPAQMVKAVSADQWGQLQEAKIVAKDKGLEAYEEITRRRIDPALLEYSGGNTFSGRVFPIPRKGFNRVILAYEETMPVIRGKVVYRFALPDCKLNDLQFTLLADCEQCRDGSLQPEGQKSTVFERTYFTHSWQEKGPGGEAVFSFVPPQASVQALSGRAGSEQYLFARLRPNLKTALNKPFAEHAVFLLDTSLSESTARFEVNMELLKKILENDPDIKKFNILTFNVSTAWVEPKGWLDNTAAGRKQAFDRLDGLLLEGATDLSAVLDELAKPSVDIAAGTPLDIFLLSDGQATWGERDAATLAARFESRCRFPARFHCYRVGLGAENQELFEALTRKGGGIFQCYSDADVTAAALAHRSQCLQIQQIRIEGESQASDVIVAGRQAAVYPGGEVVVAARCKGQGKATIVLEGSYLGQPVREEFPIVLDGQSELAARGWAEIAVASLLSLNDPTLDPVITAYCQRFGIGSRVASFLVLENESEYQRFNLEVESNKSIKGDLGKFLAETWTKLGNDVSARADFERFLARVAPRVHLLEGDSGKHVRRLLELLTEKDFEVPTGQLRGALVSKSKVPESYVRGLAEGNVSAFLAESGRRLDDKDTNGAVRALSNLIELYPSRGDALRSVGYRLLDMRQAAQAAQLFRHVERDRPFEPHSYRDLARSLEECGSFGLAALQYEIVLAGTWHSRFGQDLKNVVREEYAHMMRDAIRRKAVTGKLADHFGERLEGMASNLKPSDLRVTISWNTDNTDVDLWVIEPGGEKCFYQNRRTAKGGELSQDCTQGYGPERYQAEKAVHGDYIVMVHYFRANPNLLTGETHVQVLMTKHAGTPEEKTERRTVILKSQSQALEVGRVRF